MSKEAGSAAKSFWTWLIGNLIGFGALGAALLLLPSLMNIRSMLASTLILTIPIGAGQWLALRRISGTSILWVLTIPLGLLAGLLILQNLPEGSWQSLDDESITVLTACYMLIGLMIGIPQWLILRRQFSGSSIWLLGSSAAMGASLWLVLATDLINRSGPFAIVLGVTVYVLITGFILWRLVARRYPPQIYSFSG
jgi:hypothetical protein